MRAAVKRLFAITAAALAAPLPAAEAHHGCHTKTCRERVARKQCSQKRVVPCIRRAALHRQQPFGDLLRVARCESRLNPYAVNGPHRGLYQFNWPGTWGTTPYARRDPFSAKWNALAAAWAWSVGRRGEWQCR